MPASLSIFNDCPDSLWLTVNNGVRHTLSSGAVVTDPPVWADQAIGPDVFGPGRNVVQIHLDRAGLCAGTIGMPMPRLHPTIVEIHLSMPDGDMGGLAWVVQYDGAVVFKGTCPLSAG